MNLNIRIINYNEMSCIQSIIASIASWYNKNYILMLKDSWYFNYTHSNFESFGRHITAGNSHLAENIEKYHNLKLIKNELPTLSDVKEFSRTEIKSSRPVIIYIDQFWNIGDVYYQKKHNTHYIIVVGISEEGFICIDPWIKKSDFLLPFSDYEQGMGECFSLHVLKQNDNPYTLQEVLAENIQKMRQDKCFDNMKMFAKELHENPTLENDLANFRQDIQSAPLFIKMLELSRKRYRYSALLHYLSRKFDIGELDEMAHRIQECGDCWRMLLGRLYVSVDNDNSFKIINNVSAKIFKLAENEEKISARIYELID